MKSGGVVWQVSPRLFAPIFQGGRIRRNYDAAQARFDQAAAQYRKAVLNCYREVADSLVSVRKLGEARLELEGGVDALGARPPSPAPATTRASPAISSSSSPTSSSSTRSSSSARPAARRSTRSSCSIALSAAGGRPSRGAEPAQATPWMDRRDSSATRTGSRWSLRLGNRA